MYQTQNYTVQSHHYQPNYKQAQNQPPQNKIINSKDQAIQQLIYQNTILKRQLSQLISNHQQSNTNHQQSNTNHQQSNISNKQPNINNKQSHSNNKQSHTDNKQQINNHTSNTLQSATTTIRPSFSHLHSYRNSLDNSIDFTNQSQTTNNVMFNNKNNTIDQIQNKQIQNINIPIKHKRSYRHSVDMCQNVSNYTLLVKSNHFQNHIFTPNSNLPNNNNNLFNSNTNYQSPNAHFSQINTPTTPIFYTNQSNHLQSSQFLLNKQNQVRCSYQIKTLHQAENSISEQQLYRQKMNKLKTRKSPQGRKLSQQKQYKHIELNPTNQILGKQFNSNQQNRAIQNTKQLVIRQQQTNHTNKIKQIQQYTNKKDQLIQAHQVLKSKLNQQMIKNNLNYSITHQQIQKNKYNELISPQLIPLNNINPKSLNNTNFKKFPKYTPKNFSLEKQNQNQHTTTKSNISTTIPIHSEKITQIQNIQINSNNYFYKESQQSQYKQQKKVSIKQLKGRIYLDDQGQSARTKRALSRSNNNSGITKSGQLQNQVTLRNDRNVGKIQLSKRINTVQSQVTYVDADSYKNIGGYVNIVNTDKAVMRKNSNRVYLQQDSPNNKRQIGVLNNVSKQKQILQRKYGQKQVKRVNINNNAPNKQKVSNIDNNEQLVSIQQIHMLSIQNIDKIKIKKQRNINKNINKNKNNQQSLIINQYNNQLKQNKNNHLNNHIYCNQDNTNKDIHI